MRQWFIPAVRNCPFTFLCLNIMRRNYALFIEPIRLSIKVAKPVVLNNDANRLSKAGEAAISI
jgi:hypothetical protein